MDSLLKSLSIPLKKPRFPAHLSSESRFYEQFCRGGADHAIGIRRLGQADRKPGIACPLFSFFNKLHYRHEIDAYKYNFCRVREPYLVRLGPNGSFFVPASTAHISRACLALKLELDARKNQGIAGPLFPFLVKYIVSIN